MNKKVIYTCITGDYDDLKNHSFVNNEWDYVCFTDDLKIKNKENSIWEIRQIKYSEMDDVRNQRWHKLHPHVLFPEYEESLWVDANIDIINGGVFDDIEKIKEKNEKIAITKHPARNCLYDELEACLAIHKDNEDLMKRQIELIKKDDFPKDFGLFETNFIYRKHLDEKIIKIMGDWWHWIKNYSRRDQLSLTYVLWKNNFNISSLNDKPYNGSDLIRMRFFQNKNHVTKDELRGEIVYLKDQIVNLNENIKNKDFKYSELEKMLEEKEQIITSQESIIKQKDLEIKTILSSTSWKITKPMRIIKDKITRIKYLIRHSLYIYKNEGLVSLFKRSIKYFIKQTKKIFVISNKIKILYRKGIIAYKKDGLVYLVKKIFSYYKNNKITIKSINYSKKEVAFISGTPGASMRYRCFYQAEQLKKKGVESDIFTFEENLSLIDMLPYYDVFILHRVPINDNIRKGINIGKKNNKIFIFDSDDLIFDKKFNSSIRAMEYIPKYEADLYRQGILRYGDTMNLCDYCLASTEKIKKEMEKLGKRAFLNINSVGDEMLKLPKIKYRKNKRKIILGYMSGTNTHNFDFKEASNSLLYLLDKYKNLSLIIVGPLDLDDKFKKYKRRIIRKKFIYWKDLPKLMSRIDINLAPLEMGNDFCEAKSDLKYYEAALLKIPTVASGTAEYKKFIKDGFNGFVCENERQWKEKLEILIKDKNKRFFLGENAYKDVMTNRNTSKIGLNLYNIIKEIKSLPGKKRVVNWILQAPIKGSGGYNNIFKMANFLVSKGYTCNMYIDKVEHFSDKTDEEIYDFMYSYFDVSRLNIIIRKDSFLDSDISFATAWGTASIVKNIKNTKKRCYFVQDYEPFFFEDGSLGYELAKESYLYGLIPVTLGPYLSDKLKKEFELKETYYFDFYSDKDVYFLNSKKNNFPTRIIFYARPSTKRRGFGLGIQALKTISEKYKEAVEIVLYGSDSLSDYKIDFPYKDLGIVDNKRLAQEFSFSHIGISFSFTNMSLVPLDMMSCGCAVVELNSETVVFDLKNEVNCLLCENNQEDVVKKISLLIDNPDKRNRLVKNAYDFVSSRTYEKTTEQFLLAIKNIIKQ